MPGPLRPPLPEPSPDGFAVGLQWPSGPADPDQFHIGLFVERADEGLYFIGVGWHFRFHVTPAAELVREQGRPPAGASTWWHPVGLPPIQAKRLEAKLGTQAERWWTPPEADLPSGVAYGFFPPTAPQFDMTSADWLPKAPGDGLTCASYVLAVFRDFARTELLDTPSWENRPQDIIWQQKIISYLEQSKRKYNIEQAHIDKLKTGMGCVRFRPAEVAFAAASPPAVLPLAFAKAEPGGLQWETQIKTESAAPLPPPAPPAPGGTAP